MGTGRATAIQATIFFLATFCAPGVISAAERGSVGDLYILDYEQDRVVQFDSATGARVGVFAEFGPNYQAQMLPTALAFGGPNNNLFIAPSNSRSIVEFDGNTGVVLRNIPVRQSGCSLSPTEVKIGPNGNIFVAFHYCHLSSVEEYDSRTGAFIATVLNGASNIDKMAFSPGGTLYALRRHEERNSNYIEVLEVDPSTHTSHRIIELLSDGERGALTFGAGGKLLVTTKNDVYSYDTTTRTMRFIATCSSEILDIEAGPGDSQLVYLVTASNWVYELDTVSGRFTRRIINDADGDDIVDENNRVTLDLTIKPPMASLNQAPRAEAGGDQTVHPGTRVVLSASTSSDPDGHYFLTYNWEIQQKPAGSVTALSTPQSVITELVPDIVGDYVIVLTVTDNKGAHSQDTVTISSINSAPAADAGLDIPVVEIGSVVTLNGTGSSDPDGDTLVYRWELLSQPTGSFAQLSDPTSPVPQFVADVHGDYVVSLVVEDSHGARSDRDTVNVSFVNVAPIVVAGPDQTIVVPGLVTVTAVAVDANLDPVTFCWRLVSRPTTSLASLESTCYQLTGVSALSVDVPGFYVLGVVANDGFIDSAPSSLTIHAKSVQEAVLDGLANLRQILLGLPQTDFSPGNKQNTLLHKVDLAIVAMNIGDFTAATDHVTFIGGKTDGCAERQRVDANDWILNCTGQDEVYPSVLEIISLLARL